MINECFCGAFQRAENRWALFLKEGEMLDQKLQEYLMTDPVIQRAYENLELARMQGVELRDSISPR